MEVYQRGPGAEPWWGSEAKRTEARCAICSGQTHFRDVFIEDIRCTLRLVQSLLPPTLLLQKTLRICAISRPTMAEVGWARVATGFTWKVGDIDGEDDIAGKVE